jgi:hypothetical protein
VQFNRRIARIQTSEWGRITVFHPHLNGWMFSLKVFDMFDADRSGAIGLDELEIAITNLGMDKAQIDLEMLMKEADKRGNHQIDFDEACPSIFM